MLCLCILLLSVIFQVAVSLSNGGDETVNIGPKKDRMTRAYYLVPTTIQAGIRITKALLVRTKLETEGTSRIIYKKHGGIEQLKADFYKFKPTGIKRFQLSSGGFGKVGVVADRMLIYKSKAEDGLPTLEIVKAKDYYDRHKTGKTFSEINREVIKYED